MPRPVDATHRYLPALDGIRAIAVLAVIAYHLGLPYSDGGLLGVAVFFTLSGYLITGLLLDERARTGRIRMIRFWTRRFRRLVPAMLAVVAVVMITTAVTDPQALGTRGGEALSAVFYVNNWWEIVQGSSYFDLFAGPGPFDHLWSLSIEEQFYVVWPLVVIAALWLGRGRTHLLTVVAVLVAVASFVALWVLAAPTLDNTRAYEGTDTRVGGLLVGALAAVAVRGRLPRPRPGSATVATVVGSAATLAVLVASSDTGLGVFRWGILAVSISTAVLSMGAAHSDGIPARLLGSTPLRWIGERSYGLYLWHMPLIALLPETPFGYPVWCVIVVIATFAVAELSWSLLEDPIRRNGWQAIRPRTSTNRITHPITTPAAELRALREQVARGPGARMRWQPTVAMLAVTTVALIAFTGTAGRTDPGPLGLTGSGDGTRPLPSDSGATGVADVTGGGPAPAPGPDGSVPPPAEPGSEPLRTRCDEVVHLGDSTSVSLISESFLPDPMDRVDEQYRLVGVTEPRTEISGARSTVESFQGEPNSTDVATGITASGYRGCWVVAMGTNDAANVAAGSTVPYRDRIDRTMQAVGDGPVLWLTLRTENAANDYYAEENMQALNAEIISACERYPNMRVYDWASQVQSRWYVDDGIHFNTEGSRERARRIARALATAFPAEGPDAPGCLLLPR